MKHQSITAATQQTEQWTSAKEGVRAQTLDDHGGGWLSALRFALPIFVLTGLIYPAVTTVVGGVFAGDKATGSLIYRDGKAIGSSLIGQPFVGNSYFYGRPSAANYDPMATAGSNMAPSNPALRDRATADSTKIQAAEQVAATAIPVDMVSASGSGLDPHISPAAANLQIARVAAARGLNQTVVSDLVKQLTETPTLGIFGQPRVNVLLLNLALDGLNNGKSTSTKGG
jgi:K+-transporting ATPase ATPase C chain